MKFPLVFCLLAIICGVFSAETPNDKTKNALDVPKTTTIKPETTTHVEPTTPPTPEPKPMPKNEELHFEIRNETLNITCAIFDFVGSIRIVSANHTIANNTDIYLTNSTTSIDKSSSMCNENETLLVLNIDAKLKSTLVLHLSHIGSNYQLNQVNVTYNNAKYYYNSTTAVFQVDSNKSYKCNSNSPIQLVSGDKNYSAVVSLKNLRVDAFRTTNDTTLREGVQCVADFPTNNFVPLAVGCSLISLVFIVLIAYIVGRRRSKRLTYQSV